MVTRVSEKKQLTPEMIADIEKLGNMNSQEARSEEALHQIAMQLMRLNDRLDKLSGTAARLIGQ